MIFPCVDWPTRLDTGSVKSMQCISTALHCSCAEHPLPPVICCPNVFLPDGWGSPSSSSSSLSLLHHTHSSLPASPSFCPSCTIAITMQVMSCNVTEAGQIKGPHSSTADQLLAPVPSCACVLRPTQDNFEGVARGGKGASLLVTLRLFQMMSIHSLCDAFDYFLCCLRLGIWV